MEEAEERIGKIEDKIMKNDWAEKKMVRKLLDHEGRIKELSDSVKRNNSHIIGISEEEERKGKKVYLNKL